MNQALLDYYAGDEFTSSTWKNKYAQEGEETPNDMHMRMAKEFARVRYKKDKSKELSEWVDYFFDKFRRFQKNIPQGRVMAGLGATDTYRSLSNCLRLPPPQDSYSSIMKTDTMLVSSAKRGCGYGVGMSNLRPKGARTFNSSKTSTGVIPFGERYSNSTREVGQEGRRGACLEDLDIRHPESPDWATVKLDKTKYTGANISFKIREDFIKAVREDKDYLLRWPCDYNKPIIKTVSKEITDFYGIGNMQMVLNPEFDLVYNELVGITTSDGEQLYLKKVRAKELWDTAIHTVWSDGCPGLQFWDRIVNYDPASVYDKYKIDGTNACGEQPMAVLDTCRLLTQMLLAIVINPFTKHAKIDYEKLYEYSYIQMEIGDDLIDLEIEYIQRIIDKIKSDPEDESTKAIELEMWIGVLDMAKSGRRVGGGITALADMLASLGVKYDSQEALEIVEKVMRIKFEAELDANMDLAEKYGTFEGWNPELEKNGNDWYRFLEEEFPEKWERMQKVGRRFVNWSTIAPVGTTSAITISITYSNVTSGCEPAFGVYFFRNRKVERDGDPYDFVDEVGIKWKQYPIIMGAFKDWMEINAVGLGLPEKIDFDNLSQDAMKSLYEKSPWFGCLASDIDWKKRVEMQAILQKYTTSAISSTINLPKDVKEEVISEIYMYAFDKGLKGITCYRDGSKGGVLVNEEHKKKFDYHIAPERPKELEAELHIVTSKGQKYAVIVGFMDSKPYEMFAFKDPSHNENCTGKVIKVKKNVYTFVSEKYEIENLQVTSSHPDEINLMRMVSMLLRYGAKPQYVVEQINKSPLTVASFGKAVARVLKTYIPDGSENKEVCPECGSEGTLVYEEGCLKCKTCSYSKC